MEKRAVVFALMKKAKRKEINFMNEAKETAVIETAFAETAEAQELIRIKQMPEFEQSFIQANKEIQMRLTVLKDLDISEESKNQAKKIKADLNKELSDFEERRKTVKKEINKPYEELEKLYKGYIFEPYNAAITGLSEKITYIEKRQLDDKQNLAVEYFQEYRNSLSEELKFLNFCRLGITVNLSATEKKLKEQIRERCDKIKADIESLKTMGELSDKYILCYRNVLDVSKAISTVNAAVEEEARFKAEKEKCDKIEAVQKEAEAKVEQFAPPVEVETAEEAATVPEVKPTIEPTARTGFMVEHSLPKLKELKQFLVEGEYKYAGVPRLDKEKITRILVEAFARVYCDTCESRMNEKCCEECHRKSMNWSISTKYAEELTERIMNEMEAK